jgi:hypothetical protein
MSALAERWRAAGLVRIHRSYLVQLRFIDEFRTADLGQLTVVVDGRQLPVSRRFAPTVRGHLLKTARSVRPDPQAAVGRTPDTRPPLINHAATNRQHSDQLHLVAAA